MRVPRWYCPKAQMTWSALPDCMAARLVGSLDEVEQVVVVAEGKGIEGAAQDLRIEIELPGAMRWLRRRRDAIRSALLALLTALPGRLGSVAEVRAMRAELRTDRALVALREIGAGHLQALVRPLGFMRPRRRGRKRDLAIQHETGPDPPDA
jgi:hypothetical protein